MADKVSFQTVHTFKYGDFVNNVQIVIEKQQNDCIHIAKIFLKRNYQKRIVFKVCTMIVRIDAQIIQTYTIYVCSYG